MGYDLTLLAGEVVSGVDSPSSGLPWFRVRATLDFAVSYNAAVLHLEKEAGIPVHFYPPGEGNTEVIEDCYGNPATALPLEPVWAALVKDSRDSDFAAFAQQWLALISECPSAYGGKGRVVLWGH